MGMETDMLDFAKSAEGQIALLKELLACGARSVDIGRSGSNPHHILEVAAWNHARTMARLGESGHQGWEERRVAITRDLEAAGITPGWPLYEVVAESYPEGWDGSPPDMVARARDCVGGWRVSDGHWRVVNGPCRYFGYAMAYSEATRRLYACGAVLR